MGRVEYVIGESEPTFDAADFVRCGADLFVQRSHVTNELGIRWLARHLGPEYRIHRVQTRDSHPDAHRRHHRCRSPPASC